MGVLIEAWQRSPEWDRLAPNTKEGYARYSRPLLPLAHVRLDQVERREITSIRNTLREVRGPGVAAAFVRTVSAMFGWAIENGWLKQSPTARMKRGAGGHLPAWTPADAALAIERLPEPLRRAVVLALYTGQRRGDLIGLPWNAYDGRTLRLRQEKTGAAVVIPCHPALLAELDAWRRETASVLILVNGNGRPWRGPNLSKQLQGALARIEGFPAGRNIHGLRKLAAANLAEAGCTLHEIAAITGHRSLGMVQLYTASADQERLAEAAIIRLQTVDKRPDKRRDKHTIQSKKTR